MTTERSSPSTTAGVRGWSDGAWWDLGRVCSGATDRDRLDHSEAAKRPRRQRPPLEPLIEAHFGMHGMATLGAVFALDVDRSDHVMRLNQVCETWREARDGLP